MRIKYFSRRNWLSVCALCLVVTVLFTGCEPLRKKFTRQKKKDQVGDEKFIPVLEPQEYPVKKYGAEDSYAQHYSMFKIWFSDFANTYEQTINEKKQIYNLDAALKETVEMEKLLKSPLQEELAKIRKQVQFIRDEYAKPKTFRNIARIHSEIRSVDAAMHKSFKPAIVKGNFVGE